MKRGHESPLEFGHIGLRIVTSRDVMAELTRHRIASFAIESQRYVNEIFRRLREHEYNPDDTMLYVVGGGGCLIKNFARYNADRVTINEDICATAKGYEALAEAKLRKNEGVIV